MKFVKEYCEDAQVVVIRSGDRYGSDLQRFLDMFQRALMDGFDIQPSDCTIVQYAGKYYARTFGIEFSSANAPVEYTRIPHLEYHR